MRTNMFQAVPCFWGVACRRCRSVIGPDPSHLSVLGPLIRQSAEQDRKSRRPKEKRAPKDPLKALFSARRRSRKQKSLTHTTQGKTEIVERYIGRAAVNLRGTHQAATAEPALPGRRRFGVVHPQCIWMPPVA